MILDKIENLETYISAFKYGKEVIEFLEKTDFDKLPLGKTQIIGEELFVNVLAYTTSKTDGDFEAHRSYIDLQLVISGEERIDYTNLSACQTTKPYISDEDVEMVCAKDYSALYLSKNDFVIFFPQDAHRPSLVGKNQTPVKKAIFKIKI